MANHPNRGKKLYRITVGNSGLRGYDQAEVVRSKKQYRLAPGTVIGRITVMRKSVAALNNGSNSYVTAGGDYLPIELEKIG